MEELYAEVVIDVTAAALDRAFQYRVPPPLRELAAPGARVLVPLGTRRVEGYIVGLAGHPRVWPVRDLAEVRDRSLALEPDSLDLAVWLARRYLSPLSEALRCLAPPPGGRRGRSPAGRAAPGPVAPAEPRLRPGSGPNPTPSQEIVIKSIKEALAGSGPRCYLLHGITGSGKTEVYLQAISGFVEKGCQAVVLVPEISLTPQMLDRFRARFGHLVAVLHSRLSSRERYREWQRIRGGEAAVVVGARSAVFAPATSLGLLVIDEEHENTYKQQDNPRYHVREVALERARRAGAVVLMGSATPSVESYYRATQGEYGLLRLDSRVDGRQLPPVRIVDLRRESRGGGRIFSRLLADKIRQRLGRGEQVILFLNRRGYATFVLCRECGLVLQCPRCSVSLTYHAAGRHLLSCHYCNYRRRAPEVCPRCESFEIGWYGLGTQRVEQEARALFAGARVLRLDVDSTTRRGSHEAILGAFCRGEADILIGTQMVAKGLDIPRVTLVGVISADTSLHLPDFRSAERTFQLLTQVAGRAGRGEIPGEVVVQTYNPGHYSLQAARGHDYLAFYRQEIALRRELAYPPFSHLVNLLVSNPAEERAREVAEKLASRLRVLAAPAGDTVGVLGPAPAPLFRLRGKYRWQTALKGPDGELLRQIAGTVKEELGPSAAACVSVDVDPISML